MDIEKAFEEFIEKEWHDGHETQGRDEQYVEEMEDEETESDEASEEDEAYGGTKKWKKGQKKMKKAGIELHKKDVPISRIGISVKSSIGGSCHIDVVRGIHRHSKPRIRCRGSQLLSPLFDSTRVVLDQ